MGWAGYDGQECEPVEVSDGADSFFQGGRIGQNGIVSL